MVTSTIPFNDDGALENHQKLTMVANIEQRLSNCKLGPGQLGPVVRGPTVRGPIVWGPICLEPYHVHSETLQEL